MSEPSKKTKFDFAIAEKGLMQFVINMAGTQRQIDLDLIASLEVNKDFLKSIELERKKAFRAMYTDTDIEPDEHLTYDFGTLEEVAILEDNLNLIPEDVRTPLKLPTKRIMRKFSLPPHFYLWTLTWLDKGVKPKYPPSVVDLDIMAKSKEYLNAKTGLTTETKKYLRQLFVFYVKVQKASGKKPEYSHKEVSNFFRKLPKNVHRKKPVIAELMAYLKEEKETYLSSGIPIKKSSSFMAGNILDGLPNPPENEGKTLKQIANKLRKRKSHYTK